MRFYHSLPPEAVLGLYKTFGIAVFCTRPLLAEIGWLRENKEYAALIRSLNKMGALHWILDCGAGIGKHISPEEFAECVLDYKPPRFAAPDVLGDADATIDQYERFFRLNIPPSCSPIVALQGKTIGDLMFCEKGISLISRNKSFTLGIPYRLAEYMDSTVLNLYKAITGKELKGPTSRRYAAGRMLWVIELASRLPQREFHMFGLWHPYELLEARKASNVTSVDSSYTFLAATGPFNPFTGCRPDNMLGGFGSANASKRFRALSVSQRTAASRRLLTHMDALSLFAKEGRYGSANRSRSV